MSLFRSLNRVLKNTLAVREGRVPLDAVAELSILSLGLFSLSQDYDSENCVREFRCELSPFPEAYPREDTQNYRRGLLAPFAGCVPDCEIGRGTLTFFPKSHVLSLTLFGWSRVTVCRVAVRASQGYMERWSLWGFVRPGSFRWSGGARGADGVYTMSRILSGFGLVIGHVDLLPNFTKVQAVSPKRNLCRIHAPWQGARVQWKFQFPLHSCSLAGSTSAMKVSNWGGHLHFREVGE
ncbi:hypothetical protein Tco_0111325 [Tanacetum coccineum]